MFFLQFSFSNIVLFRRLRCREKIRLFWNIKFTWGTFYYFTYTYYNIKYTTVLFMRFSYNIDFPSDQHYSFTKQPWPETFQFVQLSHLQTFFSIQSFLNSIFCIVCISLYCLLAKFIFFKMISPVLMFTQLCCLAYSDPHTSSSSKLL